MLGPTLLALRRKGDQFAVRAPLELVAPFVSKAVMPAAQGLLPKTLWRGNDGRRLGRSQLGAEARQKGLRDWLYGALKARQSWSRRLFGTVARCAAARPLCASGDRFSSCFTFTAAAVSKA
jgi:hypothetical protein